MSALAVPARRPVLADVLAPHRTLAQNIALVGAGAGVVALLAQATIPLPLVPITGQTLGVLLVGAALGSRRGAAALLTYLLVGLAGAPVFAEFTGGPASVLSPSFGFILGFVPAAFVAGWCAERAWDRRPVRAMAGFALASAVPFLVGVPYLAMILNAVMGAEMGLGGVLAAGLWPFIPGGLVKAALAALLIPAAWRAVRALDERERD
ncbi:biotin transporter BioY [Brachybacterium saurashtrense]|uniref:Biotin transporter n=1 Tax=Brachybacterium saurashtrense TaxID=556288 RepID=A0A345YK66_9MICO|nr:biotin transporter BioY [Brachybacterium saurashtrense]AXK44318.1 biotin transporter BioY [Brachybacterium saurashtrense]RRR21354.1 biotin transporter BioY [Brachybacterium saurashtrense]RRR22929.1 biotin transporter BioY [Brachybacterium saurashtrense]